MNYKETISYLFDRLPMFSRVGNIAFKKDLTNIIELCAFLNEPHRKFRSIHIAGTNGKGSTSHMLAAVLQSAGYKTGLYTSPHLKDFRERIKILGDTGGFREVSEEFVIDFTERIKPLIEKINPSFFEISVAMAFDYFAKEKVDIAVIETGLGGRLDSTNIITPLVSVITNIEMDHTDMLGNTLQEIAFEKAGIIKPGIPVVVGELIPETAPVFEKTASDRGADMFIASQKRSGSEWTIDNNELVIDIAEAGRQDKMRYHLDLTGIYQIKNLITALETISILKSTGLYIDDDAVKNGLRNTKKITGLHGRWENVYDNPRVVLDVCHNADGFRQCMHQVELLAPHRLHIIMGIVKDKELDPILKELSTMADYYFTQADIPRALHARFLQKAAAKFNLKGKIYTDVNKALSAALAKAHPDDLILVCGSVFLIGEVELPVKVLHK